MFTALLLLACAHSPTDGEAETPAAAGTAAPASEPATTGSEPAEEQAASPEERAEHSEHAEHMEEAPGAAAPPPPCTDGARVASSLEAAAADGAERLKVVVSLDSGAAVPDLLQEPLVAGQLVQGWVTAETLCALAAADGVRSIREPIEASPK